MDKDPFLSEEADPMQARALESSLWEMDSLISSEIDEKVRNFAKIFKGDLSRKTSYFKLDDYINE